MEESCAWGRCKERGKNQLILGEERLGKNVVCAPLKRVLKPFLIV
jgi:hypothetical protein